MLDVQSFPFSNPITTREANRVMQITESLLLAFCQCAYKGFLKSRGEVGNAAEYEVIQTEASQI